MKKRWLAILIAIATCLAVLSGWSFVKVFEKDVQVVLRNGEEYVGTYTVNIFNNAVVPEPTKAGYKFAGWSPKEDWTEGTDSEDLLSENTGLIRYDDVKDYVAGENQSVTLYAAYTAIPKRDLVIAWYNKETTSGINQATMDEFKTALFEFLTSKGYKPDTMSIDIRGYEGDVGTSCGAIMKDGDVDIMVGWANSNNLTNTGGMTEGVDFLENIGNIKIGSKERYIARKTDTELCNLVYDWIHVTYSTVPVEPEPDPEPDPGPTEPVLVIAWYNLEKTSGLNQTIMDNFNAALKTYLAEHNHTLKDGEILIRAYDGTVGESCALIKEDKDVDIMLGWASTSNLADKGSFVEGVDYITNTTGIEMGGKSRGCVKVTDEEIVNLVYDWIISGGAKDALAPVV